MSQENTADLPPVDTVDIAIDEEKVTDETIADEVHDIPAEEVKVDIPTSELIDPIFYPGGDFDVETIYIPSESDTDISDRYNRDVDNTDITKTKEGRRWVETVSGATVHSPMKDTFNERLSNKSAHFRNKNIHNGMKMDGAVPLVSSGDSNIIKGDEALMRTTAFLGIGSIYQVPLYHSGIWITFRPPGDVHFAELNHLISSDKINVGRSSYGLAFSNLTYYAQQRVIDFMLDHIYNTTIKTEELDKHDLLDLILEQDLPSMIQGFIATRYSRGFKYRRACTASPGKCTHVEEGILNVAKTLFVDFDCLTDWQKNFMSLRRPRERTIEEVKKYQNEFSLTGRRQIKVVGSAGKPVSFILKNPTIRESMNAGSRWITSIVEAVEKTVSETDDYKRRESAMVLRTQASEMCQYSHFVDSIILDSGNPDHDKVIEDTASIEEILSDASSDQVLSTEFKQEVMKYINDSAMAIVGVPVYTCEKCKKKQKEYATGNFAKIIPLDMLQTFFSLYSAKMARIGQR